MPPTLLPARPTSETGPTPHYTIPYYTASHHTTPPPPPIRVRQPPDVWKGPILILRSEFIYPPCARVGERVYGSLMRACTRERISKRTANLWPRGASDFSPRSSSGPPSRRRTSFRLPRGNPFPKFRRGKSSFVQPRCYVHWLRGSSRLIGWCTDTYTTYLRSPIPEMPPLNLSALIIFNRCEKNARRRWCASIEINPSLDHVN